MSAEKKHVLLVGLDVDNDKYSWLTNANASLMAALLERRGAQVAFLSPARNIAEGDRDELVASVVNSVLQRTPPPGFVGFGVYVWNDSLVRQILAVLREEAPDSMRILGGPQITHTPAGELERLYPDADIFIRGEAEEALPRVVHAEGSEAIPGVHYAGSEDRGETAVIEDLSRLPSPFRCGFGIPIERFGRARWETKRGCPYACSFCQHRGSSRRIRYFDRRRLSQEMHQFLRDGIETLTVLDPTFNVGDTYLGILDELSELGYRGRLSLQSRFERLSDEYLERVKRLRVCLEFGLQTIHAGESEAIGRRLDLARVDSWMRRLGEEGIHYEVDLMYGLPEQTVESFQRSIEFCKIREVPVLRCWALKLLRGTKIEQERERWGLKLRDGDLPFVASSHTFTERDWEEMDGLAAEVRAEGNAAHKHWYEAWSPTASSSGNSTK